MIEAAPEANLVPKMIPELAQRSLAEMVKLPIVAQHLGPLLERHKRSIDIMRAARGRVRDGVIFFDVSDLDLEGYNKFIPYLLFPKARYSVSVIALRHALENFARLESLERRGGRDKNLASLAEEFGGGGHPRVAAISLDPPISSARAGRAGNRAPAAQLTRAQWPAGDAVARRRVNWHS